MAKRKETNSESEGKFIFRAKHFYELLERQDYKCALTGRELTPENTTAEHIVPLRANGEHSFENIYLVDEQVSKIKRYLTEEEVIDLAADIIERRGRVRGYSLKRSGRRG